MLTATARVTALTVVVLAVALGLAAPASAHGRGTYRTVVTSVRPHPAGVQVAVSVDGRRVRLTNTTVTPLELLDDDGRVLLRVDRAGVWRARPRTSSGWVRASDGPTVRFGDLRVPRVPVGTASRPATGRSVITTWQLPLRYGTQPLVVRGRMEWRTLPAPRGWILALTVLGAAFVTSVVLTGRRQDRHRAAGLGSATPQYTEDSRWR